MKQRNTNLSQELQAILSSEKVIALKQVQSLSAEDADAIKGLIFKSGWFLANRILRPASSRYIPLSDAHKRMFDFLPTPSEKPIGEWCSVSNPNPEIRERVLLGFRGLAKSTAVVTPHLVQCVLNFPDIRIRLMSGGKQTGAAQVQHVRRAFDNEVLQFFFPEFANIPVGDGESFTSPARTDKSLRDETLRCSSFLSINTSARCDYLLLDDAATSLNQSNTTRQEKSFDSFEDLRPILEPNGLLLFVGTRFGTDDLAGQIEAHAMEQEKINGTKVLDWMEVPVYTVKTGQRNQAEIDKRNAEHRLIIAKDVELTWAEKTPAHIVQQWYSQDDFESQYLLQTKTICDYRNVSISDDLFSSCLTKPFTPQEGDFAVMNLDTASASKGVDEWCLIAGLWTPSTKQLRVSHVILGTVRKEVPEGSNAISLANFIAGTDSIYGHFLTGLGREVRFRIEDAREAKSQFGEMFAAFGMKVFWQTPNNEADARPKRILALENAMIAGRVLIANDIVQTGRLREQATLYNPTSQHAHNQDGIDCLSQLYEYCQTLPAVAASDCEMVSEIADRALCSPVSDAPRSNYYESQLYRAADEKNQTELAEDWNAILNPYGRVR